MTINIQMENNEIDLSENEEENLIEDLNLSVTDLM